MSKAKGCRVERLIDLNLRKKSNMDAEGKPGGKRRDKQPSIESQKAILILPPTNPNINTRRKININSLIWHLASFIIQFSEGSLHAQKKHRQTESLPNTKFFILFLYTKSRKQPVTHLLLQ